MWNVVRIIVYLGLGGLGARYWYQHPTWYNDLVNNSSTTISSTASGTLQQTTSGTIDSGSSVVDQLTQQLSGHTISGEIQYISGDKNPFGEIYITLSEVQPTDISICTTPWNKSVAGGQYTLAFVSNHANQDNICVFEKRICSNGQLGGSYDQHTCYFDTTKQGQYEYLGIRGSDTTQLIRDAETSLGIYEEDNNGKITSAYHDDTKGVSNYSLIDRQITPQGRTNNGGNHQTNQEEYISRSQLGPIIKRTPEIRMSDTESQRINPNNNGVQGVINNQGNSPNITYTMQPPRLEATEPVPVRKSCRSPRGTEVFHNQHVLAFQSSTVAPGQACKSELRTCSQGYLRGSYQYKTCTIGQFSSNNRGPYYEYERERYDDNYDDDRYTSTTYDTNYYDNSVNRNKRYDQYESNVQSYTKSDPNSCSVTNYGILAHNSFLIMYRESNPPTGTACDGVVRTCINGSLSGPTTHNALWCTDKQTVCGDGIKHNGEQCDYKDSTKSGRGSGGCSMTCSPIQQVTIIENKCYDYTDTSKLCNGKNGGTINDSCGQVRSCPIIMPPTVSYGSVRFAAWEEINNQTGKQSCEPYISDVRFYVETCDTNKQLHATKLTSINDVNYLTEKVTIQYPYTIASTILPTNTSLRIKAVPGYSYSNYTPSPRYSGCFTLSSGEVRSFDTGFKSPVSIDNKSHPRWKFDPIAGQKNIYENPKCQ